MTLTFYKLFIHDFLLLKGDIGGQLGLFVGASIITLCEIITYFCDRCKRDKREKQIKKNNALNMTNKPKNKESAIKRGNSSSIIRNDSYENSENKKPPASINGTRNNPGVPV